MTGPNMHTINFKIIDFEKYLYSVFDIFEINLFPTYAWHTSDIVEPNVFGASFTAYNQGLEKAVANISIVDVTDDPSEPKISDHNEKNLLALDALLSKAISKEINVTEWRTSKFRDMYSKTVLVTNFMAVRDGKNWQYSCVRMTHLNRDFAIWFFFEFPDAMKLSYPIFEAVKSIKILDA